MSTKDPSNEETYRRLINHPKNAGPESPTRARRLPALDPDSVRPLATRAPPLDGNIVLLDLGSLSLENFGMLKITRLSSPPPSCDVCKAVVSSDVKCPFCGADLDRNGATPPLPNGILEYDIIPSAEQAQKESDNGMAVFCIDISGSSTCEYANVS